MTAMDRRICEHCGGDKWAARNLEQAHQTSARFRRSLSDMTHRAVKAEAKLALDKVENEDYVANLQRKIQRQGRAIRKLEQKLLAARTKPVYAEEAEASTPLGIDG